MLAACSNSNDSNNSNPDSNGSNGSGGSTLNISAVVATAAPDFSSGAVSLANTIAPYAAQNGLDATISDIAVRGDGDHYFLIKRFGTDQIQRYDAATPATPTYTYSTNDSSTEDSNPRDLIIASETKGYLIRYGSGKLWIVNPSATTEAAFKIGEIDLSQYDADGVPEMSAGLIKNGKLYVAMQRLDSSFAATQNGYVAVIDTATDIEISTGANSSGLNGIELPLRDPYRLVSVPDSNAILVAADGGYDGSFNQQYDGGVVSIDPDNSYGTTLLLDDGDSNSHPYGTFADVTVAAGDRGYFIGSTGFGGTQSLYRFNPGSPDTPVPVSNFQNLELGPIAVDPNGNLWLGQINTSAPGLTVLGFQGGTETVLEPLIDTVLTPLNIDFVSVLSN